MSDKSTEYIAPHEVIEMIKYLLNNLTLTTIQSPPRFKRSYAVFQEEDAVSISDSIEKIENASGKLETTIEEINNEDQDRIRQQQ